MTALKTYAQMADNVYEVPDGAKLLGGLPSVWSVYDAAIESTGGQKGGVVHNSGFKGCIYKSPAEMVVCFKGTGGGKAFQDFLADVKLAGGVIPREATPAKSLVEKAMGVYNKERITVVGHSLGGGLTQVVCHWFKLKFVTFNAPPMGGCIQKAKINFFKPQQAVRAMKASLRSGADGHNYRLQGDVVSSRKTSVLGHYGAVTTFNAPGVNNPVSAHLMTAFCTYLSQSSDGNTDPFGL